MDVIKEKRLKDSPRTITVSADDEAIMRRLVGGADENLRALSEALDVRVGARGGHIQIDGEESNVVLAARVLEGLAAVARRMDQIRIADVHHAIAALRENEELKLETLFLDVVATSRGGRKVTPRGLGQKRYVDAMRQHDIVFGVGPAGTGKTYLAVAFAIEHLKAERVAKIVLTRPAVEAGEKLGFLPGDIEAKVNPYLRPLYDALHDLLGPDEARQLMERQVIEVAPLAFMRGRTLSESFVILDEAQNTTREQMKMFLTRLGERSKMVICGDVTQIDLPQKRSSGLLHSVDVLERESGIGVVRFSHADVVRHDLVQRIVRAYERHEGQREGRGPAR